MLLSTNLSTLLHLSPLKLPAVKTALVVSVGAITWGGGYAIEHTSWAHGDHTVVAQHQTNSTVSSTAYLLARDEVQYIGDKFSADQQRLQAQPSEESVPSF